MTTLETLTGKPHVSYSGLTTWLDCGEKYRLQRIVGINEDPAYYLAGGTAVHTATEAYDNAILTGSMHADAVATAVHVFTESFQQQLDERPNGTWRAAGRKTAAWPNGEDRAWWLANGITQVSAYCDWRRQHAGRLDLWATESGVNAVELPVDPVFPGDIPLKGYIDRVFTSGDDLIVVDLKTGSREPASALQLGFYAVALEKQYGVRPKWGAYFMTRKGELGQLIDLTHYTESMLAYQLRQFVKAVTSGIFVPHVSMLCSGCGVKDACYAVNPDLEPPDLDFDADLAE